MKKNDFLKSVLGYENGKDGSPADFRYVFLESAAGWNVYDSFEDSFFEFPAGQIVCDVLNAVHSGTKSDPDLSSLFSIIGNLDFARTEELNVIFNDYLRQAYAKSVPALSSDPCRAMLQISDFYDFTVFRSAGSAVLPDKNGTQIYYNLYVSAIPGNAFFADLRWLFFGKTKRIHYCLECRKLYLSNNGNTKFCPACQLNYQKRNTDGIRQHTCKYLHKKAYQKIKYNLGADAAERFRLESNYYYGCVRKKLAQKPDFPVLLIKTEKQYLQWLTEKDRSASKR